MSLTDITLYKDDKRTYYLILIMVNQP